MKLSFLLSIVFLSSQLAFAQLEETFTDSRDGEVYSTITIVDPESKIPYVWMAQNLRYETSESWIYEKNSKYLKEYGRLYRWSAASNACPTGWHLPTKEEWSILVNNFGGDEKAGHALKSVTGWEEDGNGDNSSGFNAKPGGSMLPNYQFKSLGRNGFWWTSSEEGSAAWVFYISLYSSSVNKDFFGKQDSGLSIRCVKNNWIR